MGPSCIAKVGKDFGGCVKKYFLVYEDSYEICRRKLVIAKEEYMRLPAVAGMSEIYHVMNPCGGS